MDKEMKRISILITNMTLNNATPDELERVIDYSSDFIYAIRSRKSHKIEELEDKYLNKEA